MATIANEPTTTPNSNVTSTDCGRFIVIEIPGYYPITVWKN